MILRPLVGAVPVGQAAVDTVATGGFAVVAGQGSHKMAVDHMAAHLALKHTVQDVADQWSVAGGRTDWEARYRRVDMRTEEPGPSTSHQLDLSRCSRSCCLAAAVEGLVLHD